MYAHSCIEQNSDLDTEAAIGKYTHYTLLSVTFKHNNSLV